MSCERYRSSYEFDPADAEKAAREGTLLSMEVEFSRRCNFDCPYCYVPNDQNGRTELTPAEIRDGIHQAKELGARKIIVLGGEPMIYPKIMEKLEFIRSEGMSVELFTNGTGITPDSAKRLAELNVKVVLKMNTRDPKLQDILSGHKGANRIISDAFDALTAAGYPGEGREMGVSTVMCRDNAEELVDLWQWLRDHGIDPYFEMITPQGEAPRHPWLYLEDDRIQQIFDDIREVDRERYGIDWEPQPPLVGNRCLRHMFSCVLTSYGDIFPCVGVNIAVGNIRDQKLRDIIRDSEVIQDLRNYRKTITGPCSKCGRAEECYGCRGAAYQLTGNYLASDPLCWRNLSRRDEIRSLPMPVDEIIPQDAPMRVVDTLVSIGEREAVVELTVRDDSPLLDGGGRLDGAAYLEIMAQSAAAMNGFRARSNGNGSKEGFLLGARKLEILASARVGDTLRVAVHKRARLDSFGIIASTVSRDNEVIARGEIKVWAPETVE